MMEYTSKQEDNQEQRFLQNEVHTKCTTLSQNPRSGWLLIVWSMQ
jgi:hypothetical protein